MAKFLSELDVVISSGEENSNKSNVQEENENFLMEEGKFYVAIYRILPKKNDKKPKFFL